jgi:succinate dehydrogenase / fumarate reductase membrane anchor subunit
VKSPLNQVLGLGSAKEGTSHWWHQRLTAVALVPLGFWFVASMAALDLASYEAVVSWIRQPLQAVLLTLTASCIIYHSWLGVRVVVEDYIGAKGAKVVALSLSSFAHVFLAAACLFAIFKVALGAS